MLEQTARRLELARAILGDERLAYVETQETDAARPSCAPPRASARTS